VRFLTQEQLVRKAVAEGLGRALRQVYTDEQAGLPPQDIARLLAQLSNNEPIVCRSASSFISATRPSGLRARGPSPSRSR
jgi:hypothetical protein